MSVIYDLTIIAMHALKYEIEINTEKMTLF